MEDRFKIVRKEHIDFLDTYILKDKQTGVCYLLAMHLFKSMSLTPLLDSDGKPIIDRG